MARAVGPDWSQYGDRLWVDYGFPPRAHLDGMVGASIAVEVESREPKQVRGAILDLISHPAPRKLLVLIPAYNNAAMMRLQAEAVLSRWLGKRELFRVVALSGKADRRKVAAHAERVRRALFELGWEPCDPRAR